MMDQQLESEFTVELKDEMDNMVFSENSKQKEIIIMDERVDSHKVVIHKNGYLFNQKVEQVDSYNWINRVNIQKLSKLEIQIFSNQKSLQNVNIFIQKIDEKTKSLSVSGMTDLDGVYINTDLKKGKYLIKPVMMEYKFDPIQQVINLEEGKHVSVKIRATKFLFSVYGKVKDLNQNGLANITIQVHEQNNSQNSFKYTTNYQGQYRIQKLQTNTTYTIRLLKNP